MSRRRRAEARRAVRPEQDLGVRLRGAALETRRRLRPLAAPVAAFFSWIGRPVARALLFVIQLFAALVARGPRARPDRRPLGRGRAPERRADRRGGDATARQSALDGHLRGRLRGGRARGIAVLRLPRRRRGCPGLRRARSVRSRRSRSPTGKRRGALTSGSCCRSPPLAAILIVAAYRGRPRLAAGVAVCGLIGLAVALAVDLPQGLEVGRPGLAFTGTQAQLLQGFWAEVASSAVLILCGGLLAHYSRGVTRERRRRRGRSGGDTRHSPHREAGGIYPGLQAEQ